MTERCNSNRAGKLCQTLIAVVADLAFIELKRSARIDRRQYLIITGK